MTRVKMILAIVLVAASFVSHAQNNQGIPSRPDSPKLIAVVNKANWCSVCKANGDRFAGIIKPYTSKGLDLYVNDLTNDSTKASSKLVLERENVYEAVTTIPRKGMGKMLKSCGMTKDKKQATELSGIVTFINPRTHRMVRQMSIATPDKEMKATIDDLLKL